MKRTRPSTSARVSGLATSCRSAASLRRLARPSPSPRSSARCAVSTSLHGASAARRAAISSAASTARSECSHTSKRCGAGWEVARIAPLSGRTTSRARRGRRAGAARAPPSARRRARPARRAAAPPTRPATARPPGPRLWARGSSASRGAAQHGPAQHAQRIVAERRRRAESDDSRVEIGEAPGDVLDNGAPVARRARGPTRRARSR